MDAWWVWAAVGLGGLGLAYVALPFVVRAPVYLVLPALEAGRYEQALARMRYLWWAPGSRVLVGALLFHLDRLEEAEAHLREVEATTGQGAATRAWVHIGQGRYDDALEAVPRSVVRVGNADVTPTPWASVECITELLVGRASSDTVRRLDAFYVWKRDDHLGHETSWEAELLAARSWARRVIGDATGAQLDAEQAVQALPAGNPSAAGEVYFLLAMAADDQGEPDVARACWERSAAADPRGVWGRIARDRIAQGGGTS